MTSPMRWAFGVLLCADLLAGCAKPLPPQSVASVTSETLPRTVAELIAFADKALEDDSPVSIENALAAADKAMGLERENPEVLVRVAHASELLAEMYLDHGKRRYFANHGVVAAKALERLVPARVEGHYYHGSNVGLYAATKTIGAVLILPEVVRAAKRAIEKDEHYDHAGPLRLLGTVFTKAPAWPASVGDVDEGIKYLKRAITIAPEYPLNHLFFGDALLLDGQRDEAAKQYEIVLASESKPEFAHRIEKWHAEATAALQKLRKRAPPAAAPPAASSAAPPAAPPATP